MMFFIIFLTDFHLSLIIAHIPIKLFLEQNVSSSFVCDLIDYFDAYIDLRSNGAHNLHNNSNNNAATDDRKKH